MSILNKYERVPLPIGVYNNYINITESRVIDYNVMCKLEQDDFDAPADAIHLYIICKFHQKF